MPDADVLLCESCGYDLGGLTAEGRCPECGKPVAESIAERHTGAPWERRGPIRAQVRTLAALFADSRDAFSRCRSPCEQAPVTQAVNSILTAVVPVGVACGVALISVLRGDHTEIVGEMIGMAIASFIIALVVTAIVSMAAWIAFSLIARIVFRCRSPMDAAGHALTAWSCAWPLATAVGAGGVVLGVFVHAWLIALVGLSLLFLLVTFIACVFGLRGMKHANPPGAGRHLRGAPVEPI